MKFKTKFSLLVNFLFWPNDRLQNYLKKSCHYSAFSCDDSLSFPRFASGYFCSFPMKPADHTKQSGGHGAA
ncbi:TPA: hypothetical protein ACSP3J_000538 [Aeromonas hydrophila]